MAFVQGQQLGAAELNAAFAQYFPAGYVSTYSATLLQQADQAGWAAALGVPEIVNGEIDGVAIGLTTPAQAKFTSVTITTGGTFNGVAIGQTTPGFGGFTSLGATGQITSTYSGTSPAIQLASATGGAGVVNKLGLLGTTAGIGASTNSVDYVVPAGYAHSFYVTGTGKVGQIDSAGVNIPVGQTTANLGNFSHVATNFAGTPPTDAYFYRSTTALITARWQNANGTADISFDGVTRNYSNYGNGTASHDAWSVLTDYSFYVSGNLKTQITSTGLLADIGQTTAGKGSFTNLLASTSFGLPSYTIATVPTGTVGQAIYVSNGQKPAEAPSNGTGVICVYSNGKWRRTEDDADITSSPTATAGGATLHAPLTTTANFTFDPNTGFTQGILFNGAHTGTLPSGVGAGWTTGDVTTITKSSVGKIVPPSGGNLIDGSGNSVAFVNVVYQQKVRFFFDGTNWRTTWIDRTPILWSNSVSSIASFDFQVPSGYQAIEFEFTNYVPSTTGTDFGFRVSADGSTFLSASSAYQPAATYATLITSQTANTTYATSGAGMCKGVIEALYGSALGVDARENTTPAYANEAIATRQNPANTTVICNFIRFLCQSGTFQISGSLRGIPAA